MIVGVNHVQVNVPSAEIEGARAFSTSISSE